MLLLGLLLFFLVWVGVGIGNELHYAGGAMWWVVAQIETSHNVDGCSFVINAACV